MKEQVLRDRELDRLVAEKVMGWVDFWQDRDGAHLMGYPPNEQTMGIEAERAPIPAYSASSAAVRLVEDEIERQGDRTQQWYVWHLADQIGHPWYEAWTLLDMFLFLRATPKQRCFAALKAYGVEVPD